MSVLTNKWFQWLVVMIIVVVVRAMAAGILDVPSGGFPTRNLLAFIDHRDWAGTAYHLIYNVGELVKGAYLLRAFGLIEFIK